MDTNGDIYRHYEPNIWENVFNSHRLSSRVIKTIQHNKSVNSTNADNTVKHPKANNEQERCNHGYTDSSIETTRKLLIFEYQQPFFHGN